MLNTAPFSTLRPDNKEIHYIPDSLLFPLEKKEEVDLAITVMHHGTEWFHEKTKDSLEKMIRRHSDIVFQGHGHSVRTIQSEGLVLSKGGEYSGKMTHASTFSTLIFDTESSKCNEIEFEWNDAQTMFFKKEDPRCFTVLKKTNALMPNDDFTADFFEDQQKLTKNTLEYFVFPKLFQDRQTVHDEGKLITEESFWTKLDEHKIINISGKDGNGKTILLKYFFNQCVSKHMVPLYFGHDTYRSKLSADKILKNLFEEQYGEAQILYEKYEQIDMRKKILLIDDLDLISPKANQKKLLDMMKNKVSCIIFTSKNVMELNAEKMTKDIILESEEYYSLKIDDFYKEKRTELVRKIYEARKQNSAELLDYIIEVIDRLVVKRYGLFELSPEYIVQYVKFFLNREPDDRKDEAVFNVVFETNIRNAILQSKPHYSIEYCLLTLEEIAFQMHQNKNEHINYLQMVKVIDDINLNRNLLIDHKKCISNVVAARILKSSGEANNYEFSNRNYLAYFIAKKLNKLIEKRGLHIPELQYVFTNICFGINDNILLFLSFFRDNTAFALNLCDMLEEIIGEYPELDFDKNNINFIRRQSELNLSIPTQKEKDKIANDSDEMEKHMREQEREEIQYRGLYDYDENDINKFSNKIVRALKYLEIISKSLISHYVNLDSQEKRRIINLMYSAPSRLLYALLKPFDEQYEVVIDGLKRFIDSMEGAQKMSREAIEDYFNRSAIAICLSVYDNIAFFGTNDDTLRLLNESDMLNSNYKILNLTMEENGGSSNSFVEKAISLKEENEKDIFFINLIRLIVRKHLITKTIDYKINDRIADKIFPATPKQKILISSLVSDNKKE